MNIPVQYYSLDAGLRAAKQTARIQAFRALYQRQFACHERDIPSYDATLHKQLIEMRDTAAAWQQVQDSPRRRSPALSSLADQLAAMAHDVYHRRRQAVMSSAPVSASPPSQPQKETPHATSLARIAEAAYALRRQSSHGERS